MPLSFEELADAGIDIHESEATKRHHPRRWQVLLLGLLSLTAAVLLYWRYENTKTYDSIATQILLSESEEGTGILPHVKDSATEFESSLEFLKKDASAPKVRETKEASMVEAPAYTASPPAPTIQLDTQKPAETANAPRLPPSIPTTQQASAQVSQIPKTAIIDWSGTVLVPKNHILAKAYNSDIRLLRIEAHPIDGEHIRVWARIQNLTDHPLQTEVGCEFRGNEGIARPQFAPIVLPPMGVADTYFVSQKPEVHAYTFMVKR